MMTTTDARIEDPTIAVRDTATEIVSGIRELLGVDRALDEARGRLDPVGFGTAWRKVLGSLAGQPVPVGLAAWRFSSDSGRALFAAVCRAAGVPVDGPAELTSEDRRYRDPAYESNPWFYLARQEHALFADHLRALGRQAGLDPASRRKIDFVIGQIIEGTAPPNWLLTNPKVLKHAFDTGGHSLVRGARNLVRDVLTNRGRPRQVTPGQFRIGTDIAATQGAVVHRNRLIELIQFAPRTATVHEVPILFSPPWINKYYIMDLAPGKSLIEWAVRHGHTCFVVSYRNPDESLRDVGMSEYLREGLLAAMDVIGEITDAKKINVAGLCLGGTMASAASAWLAARGDERVNSLTLMNTLLDFQAPGQLGVFTDERTVRLLERQMERKGYLPAESMKTTFDLLRATDLVWNYVVNDWMLGEDPAPFDMLTWNSDSTRMPAAMQTEYLRTCYLQNQLARGTMTLAGERLDLGDVRRDAYVVTAEADHIAPWRAVFTGARLLGGTVRFVLSNSGHIAGVVNPPSSKSRHWYSETAELPVDPDAWRAGANEHAKSWWEDWTPWIETHGGEQRTPPRVGSATHPPLGEAPGSYVLN